MDQRKALHFQRLRQSLEQIAELTSGKYDVRSPEFESWQQRTLQSLKELFSENNDYFKRFQNLQFWSPRVSIGSFHWSNEDQSIFISDMRLASQTLRDALEESNYVAEVAKDENALSQDAKAPQIVLNITNILSQVTEIRIDQINQRIDDMPLSHAEKDSARVQAIEMKKEIDGNQRWPILAKLADGLKSIGKTVYKEVAIPLLLEMLKKQLGL